VKLPSKKTDTSIEFEVGLNHDFHLSLVTSDWLSQLGEYLFSLPPLNGKPFHCRLTSRFNEDRFMGPESVTKYRFETVLDWQLPESCPVDVSYDVELEYRPNDSSFKRLSFRNQYSWRTDEPGGLTDLESTLVSHGVVVPMELPLEEIDEELVDSCYGSRTDSLILGVRQDRDQIFAVFEDLRDLDVAKSFTTSLPITPVRLTSGYTIDDIVSRYFGRKVELEEAVVHLEELQRIWEGSPEDATGPPALNEPYFQICLLQAFYGFIRATIVAHKAWIETHFFGTGNPRFRHQELSPGDWFKILEMAEDQEVWNPPLQRSGLDGFSWSINAWDGREIYHWLAPYDETVRFCLACLKFAGVDLELRHYKSWVWESEITSDTAPMPRPDGN